MAPGGATSVGWGGDFDRERPAAWVRTPEEIAEKLDILGTLLEQMTMRGDRTADDLSYGERYTLGLRAAARWTLAETSLSPLTSGTDTPTPDRVADEMAIAEFVIATRKPGHDLAAGVLAWLRWMLGQTDQLVFSALDA
jgi:hypothetical protein